jgi:WD40 repeat protein
VSDLGELVGSLGLPNGAHCAAWSPDGEWFAVGSGGQQGGLAVVDAETVTVRWQAYGEWGVADVGVSSAGDRIAVAEVRAPRPVMGGQYATRLRVLDAGTGAERWSAAVEVPSSTYFVTPVLAVSPDNHTIAAYWTFFVNVDPDNPETKGWVFDVASGARLRELFGSAAVRGVAFSPDSRRVVAARADGVVVFDADSGTQAPRSFTGDVLAAAFSPDGEQVVAGCADGTARVFEAGTGTAVSLARLTETPGRQVMSVAFNPDDRWAAGVTMDGAVVFGVADGVPRFPSTGVPVHGGEYDGWKAAFSPDLRHLTMSRNQYQGGYVGGLSVLDARTGGIAWQMTADGFVNDIAYNADATLLLAAAASQTGQGGVVRLHDTGLLRSRLAHRAPVTRVAATTGGARLVATASGDTASVFHADSGGLLLERVHPGVLTAIAFAPDGARFATGATTGARLFETVSGRLAWTAEHGPVNALAISPGAGEWVATASNDRNARVMSSDTGVERWKHAHPGPVTSIAFSPDARWVATGAGRSTRILDATTGGETLRVDHDSTVQALEFSPEGSLLATANRDGTVRLIDPTTGAQGDPIPHPQPLTAVAFKADGTLLATGDADRTIRIFGVTGVSAQLLAQQTYESPITALAFAPDGPLLAVVTEQSPVQLVDPTTAETVQLLLHPAPANDIAFGPGVLATAYEDNTARVYNVGPLWELSNERCNSGLR